MKINLTRIFILVCLVLFFATNVTAGRTDKLARLKAKKAHQLEQLIQSAEQGNAEAQEKLGEHYRDKGMYDQAFYWLQQAANQNIASAQFSLSIFYYKGLSVEQNQEKAISLIKQAATNGYSEAQTIIGKEAVKNEDFSAAAVWFEKAAEQNDPTAMIFLSNLFYSGKGVEQNTEKTFYWLKRAAETGSPNATFKLGICYIQGIGVPQDQQKAIKLLKRAALAGHNEALSFFNKEAERGNADAQLIMAQFFGTHGGRQKAFSYYLQAAKNNNRPAQNKLAEIYLSESLPAEISTQIRTWIKESATNGDAIAQCQLARIYSSISPVTDVSPNPDMAVTWLTKGLQKDTDCSKKLANELLTTESISPQEQQLVVDWIKKEAATNDLALGRLGWIYLNGTAAIPQNQEEALKIFYKIAGSGDVATQCELGLQFLSGELLQESFVTGMAFYYVAASGEIVNGDSGNDYWVKKAKEKITETESEQPEKSAALADARKLAQKLIMKFQEKS